MIWSMFETQEGGSIQYLIEPLLLQGHKEFMNLDSNKCVCENVKVGKVTINRFF